MKNKLVKIILGSVILSAILGGDGGSNGYTSKTDSINVFYNGYIAGGGDGAGMNKNNFIGGGDGMGGNKLAGGGDSCGGLRYLVNRHGGIFEEYTNLIIGGDGAGIRKLAYDSRGGDGPGI